VVSSRPFLRIAVPAKTISTEALRSTSFPGHEGAAAIRRLRTTRLSPDAIAEATGSPLAQIERALETA
jgi:hypothetical protein